MLILMLLQEWKFYYKIYHYHYKVLKNLCLHMWRTVKKSKIKFFQNKTNVSHESSQIKNAIFFFFLKRGGGVALRHGRVQ